MAFFKMEFQICAVVQHANIIHVGGPSVPDPPFQQSGEETPDVPNPQGRTRRCLLWDVQPEEYSHLSLLQVCFSFVVVSFVGENRIRPI